MKKLLMDIITRNTNEGELGDRWITLGMLDNLVQDIENWHKKECQKELTKEREWVALQGDKE